MSTTTAAIARPTPPTDGPGPDADPPEAPDAVVARSEAQALLTELLARGRLTWPHMPEDSDLEALYIAASQAFDRGAYEQALPVFGLLAGTDPWDFRYQHAVATCLQRLGRYKEAAALYVQLQILEPETPEALFRAAECILATGDTAAAIGLLDALATDYLADTSGWTERAAALRRLLGRTP